MAPERRTDGWLTVRSLVEGMREQHVAVDKDRVKHSVFLFHRPKDDQFVVEHKVERPNGKSSWSRLTFGRDVRRARKQYGAIASSIQITG